MSTDVGDMTTAALAALGHVAPHLSGYKVTAIVIHPYEWQPYATLTIQLDDIEQARKFGDTVLGDMEWHTDDGDYIKGSCAAYGHVLYVVAAVDREVLA